MREIVSGFTTTRQSTLRTVAISRQQHDDTMARLASDITGMVGTPDPDQVGFLTPALRSYRLVQATSGNNTVGTLALMPDQQYSSLEDRYYKSGTALALDRVGSGAAGFNIIRPGRTPDGYFGGDKVLVQKRYKLYPAGDEYPDIFVYAPPVVRTEPKDYVLQEDERFDGGFFAGSVRAGVEQPFGTTFPTDGQGHYVFNDDPFTDAGWSGNVNVVPENPATRPTITLVDPDYLVLPDVREDGLTRSIVISGTNFGTFFGDATSTIGFVMIGPYRPDFFYGIGLSNQGQFGGAYNWRFVQDDTFLVINCPSGMNPGAYDVYIIGNDGQMAVSEQKFTVYAEGEGP